MFASDWLEKSVNVHKSSSANYHYYQWDVAWLGTSENSLITVSVSIIDGHALALPIHTWLLAIIVTVIL